ncbi:4'-phosphopantetheinyl transferase family protein [Vibrio atypicus]|uniref:4'-phosphopantetheinyl transferase family protein n=1 Tax=Vibrio atypicus TaxID=558271 RepID=UPI00135938D0|nr:4'-phosphopantetheinyl transferase superfamily protein [Vibrio atypicus]
MLIQKLPDTLKFHHLNVEYCPQFVEQRLSEGIPFPEFLHRAVLKRRCEFLAGRACSKRGLLALNHLPALELKVGEHNQPLWPEGIVGSISHCVGHAVAVVGRESVDLLGVGIDIERVVSADLAQQIGDHLLSKPEQNIAQTVFNYQQLVTVVFSAKESIYKAIFPTVNRILGFESVELVKVNAEKGELVFEFCFELKQTFNHDITVYYEHWGDELFLTWCCLAERDLRKLNLLGSNNINKA